MDKECFVDFNFLVCGGIFLLFFICGNLFEDIYILNGEIYKFK